MDYVTLGVAAGGLIWILLFGYIHMRAVNQAKAAEGWPVAPGRIVASHVVEEESTDREGGTTTWYNPAVRYAYAAGGDEMEGSRLRYGNCRSTSREKAEAALVAYPAGASVQVRYNPQKPSECVLETQKPGPIYLAMAAFGILFLAIALFWKAGS